VLDWYGPSYGEAAVKDPLESRSTLSDKPRRVLRGGSWLRDAKNARCAARYRNTPGSRNADNGFRVVASVDARPVAAATATAPARPAVSAGTASGGTGEGWPTWLALLCPVGLLAFGIWVVAKIVRRVFGGPAGVRSHIGDDGFWIYSPDETRGRPIFYRAMVGGSAKEGTIASPGSQGEYVYTGARPSNVKMLGMAASAATTTGTFLGQSDDEDRRRREREEADRQRRDRDSSSFTGYPSAY
jgi:hypothetical protein